MDLVTLQDALDAWPERTSGELEALAPRLASALAQAAIGDCGALDLAGLVRDALRHWQETTGRRELPTPLNVPAREPWPTVEGWRGAGITAAPGARETQLRLLDVVPWSPAWAAAAEPLDAFPASRVVRRHDELFPADPVWRQATGLASYRSLEQRAAVRTVLTSGPNATVLVLLPTGSGKSLVATLQPLADGPAAVSLVVVPTVSLALDQETQLREHLRRLRTADADQRFAFHSGLSQGQRGEILERIRNGGQRVVFTSPEALFGALGERLLGAAREGRFRQFAIDEAHVVASWGAHFRPDFQALAAFREQLRNVAAEGGHRFRTLLMTATAAQEDVRTLHSLFSSDGAPLTVGGAVALRPELAYAVAEAADPEQRTSRVIEALRRLPRPLFIYTATKRDAAAVAARVVAEGVRRCVTVTGDSSDVEREGALQALRGSAAAPPTADVVVATSAFGLGIDVADVRSVVHACLPESIDRYYQEVGRAGRDGRAALGLLLWTADDRTVATKLSERRLIGVDLARQRWQALVAGTERDADDVLWVELRALRVGLFEDSEENLQWNARTLSSMVAAGFLRPVGSRRDADAPAVVGVRRLRDDLADAGSWAPFEAMRVRSRRDSAERLALVEHVARTSGVCDALSDFYTVIDPEHVTADLIAHHACGGCADCGPDRPDVVPPLPIGQPRGVAAAAIAYGRHAGADGVVLALTSDARHWGREYGRLLAPAVDAGVRHVVCSPRVWADRGFQREIDAIVQDRGLHAPLTTVVASAYDEALDATPWVPTLMLLGPGDDTVAAQPILRRLLPSVVAVLPANGRAPDRPDMTLAEMHPGAMSPADLEKMLSACRI
jgi:superfamily II DNA/RNA helicase